VAGSCEFGDEPSGSGATEVVVIDNMLFNDVIAAAKAMYRLSFKTRP
jgi:hypothetical protein